MLILCSNGLSSPKLLNSIKNILQGFKRAALVVTADNIYKENNYHVARCIKELESLGLTAATFDLDKQDAKDLLNYDVVEFIGGNPFYLLNSIRECNASDILKEIANSKVLIGWSAAAFVFSPTLDLVNMYSPEMNFLGLHDLTALALTSIEVLPHYSKFITKFEDFEEKCRVYEETHNIHVIRLNDGDGVIIDNEHVLLCRS